MKFSIPASLLQQKVFQCNDDGESKAKFHADGKKFLKALAAEIGVTGKCDIRSNLGGGAVLGEVTLHADSIYIQLFEFGQPGVRIMYRSCEGRKDYTGGNNMYVDLTDLQSKPEVLDRFIAVSTRMAKAGIAA